jgi:PAS domain S-box-containing protein
MVDERIRVLMVEDSPTDALLIQHALAAGPARFDVTHVERLTQALDRLASGRFDVILLDLGLPDSQGLEALARLRDSTVRVPIVVLTARADDVLAVRSLQEGAQDYVAKSDAVGPVLTRIIRYAIERRRYEEALRESEARLRQLADNIPAGFIYQVLLEPNGKVGFTYCSAGIEAILGFTPEEAIADPMLLFRMTHDDDASRVWELNAKVIRERIPFDCEFRQRTRSGEMRWLHCRSTPRPTQHGTVWDGLAVDITARRRAEETRQRLITILETTTDFVGTFDAQGRALYVNHAGRVLCGIPDSEDLMGVPIVDFHPAWASEIIMGTGLPAAARDGSWTGETALLRRNNLELPASQVILAHFSPTNQIEYYSTIIRDLSEYKRLQEQFLHAQKMEAIGRLAGGVAHDFNNLLTVIRGYGESLLLSLPDDTPERNAAREISRAATMASALTRQLLAFSRRDAYLPIVVNPNQILSNMERMMRRVLPENVKLDIRAASDTRPVRADAGQLGQVILNLVINARDAMPTGGTLTVETANRLAGDSSAGPGSPQLYTILRVSDTGCGMTPELKERIFDPFFTTKPRGQGSGLGLATVFGIVKQSGGVIEVVSEPGQGSTFTVLLPSAGLEPAPSSIGATSPSAHGQVLLLVEDETKLRVLARTILQKAGYQVLDARDAAEARRLAASHKGPLHLLLVKPDQTELAAELGRERPELKVLLCSGGSQELASLPHDMPVLRKPYEPELLIGTVRSILEPQAQTS